MATKKAASRTFKRPSAAADKSASKKKVAAKKPAAPVKKSEPNKIDLVLDETHVELHEENTPQEDPQREKLAEELFQEPVSDKIEEKAADVKSVEEPEKQPLDEKEAGGPSSEEGQEKVDELVSKSVVVDQKPTEEEVADVSPTEHPVEPHVNSAVTVEENNSLRWVLVLIILFLVGLMGGLFYFFIWQNKVVEKPKSTLKTVAVYTPSPTPATIPKVQVTIKVLNGSGEAGVAASVQTMLTSAGYNVVDIDNADNSNYTKTEIQAKDTVDKIFLTDLEQALATKYTVDATVSPTTSGETDDVVVIVGSDTK